MESKLHMLPLCLWHVSHKWSAQSAVIQTDFQVFAYDCSNLLSLNELPPNMASTSVRVCMCVCVSMFVCLPKRSLTLTRRQQTDVLFFFPPTVAELFCRGSQLWTLGLFDKAPEFAVCSFAVSNVCIIFQCCLRQTYPFHPPLKFMVL